MNLNRPFTNNPATNWAITIGIMACFVAFGEHLRSVSDAEFKAKVARMQAFNKLIFQADSLSGKGRYDEAALICKKAAAMQLDYDSEHWMLGSAYADAHLDKEAIEQFRIYIHSDIDIGFGRVFVELGDALYRTKDVEGAKVAWRSASTTKDPERAEEAAGRLKSLELGKPPHLGY
jgi:tetratricopeptide (TPR) repeat protein